MDKLEAVRVYLRSLNVLLKTVRMYGFEHVRAAEQLSSAWADLRKCLETDGSLKIAVTGAKLIIDGNPYKANPAESGFASMLSGAGISSIHFADSATQEDFSRFARAFSQSGGKLEGLLEHLREALAGGAGIRINEVRFVEADSESVSGAAEARMVGEFAARALGAESGALRDAITDPRKLLALIAAAEGVGKQPGQEAAGGGTSGAAGGDGGGRETHKSATGGGGAEPDLMAVMQVLGKLGTAGGKAGADVEPGEVLKQVRSLPASSQQALRGALDSLLEADPGITANPQLLVQLAERLAIQYALRRYESGETRVDAVRESLGRMAHEIETLRKKLAAAEQSSRRDMASDRDQAKVLEQDFWSALSDEAKCRALMSPDVWTFPHRNVRDFSEQLREQGESSKLADVLSYYAAGVRAEKPQLRKAAAEGLSELADLYAKAPPGTLEFAVTEVGEQLSTEELAELHNPLSSVLVRLGQVAGDGHLFEGVKQVLICQRLLVHRQPALATGIAPRIGLEKRVPEWIEVGLRQAQIPTPLIEVLQEMPRPAILYAAAQFSQATLRERGEKFVALASALGPEATQALSEVLERGPDSEAISTVGLLARLEIGAVGEQLRARLPRWNHSYQNLVVRQIASSGAPGRGRLLLHVFDLLDPLVLPPVIDEMGLSGDTQVAPKLLSIAGGEIPAAGSPYLILKAIEALGRLRVPESAPILKKYVEEKRMWRWAHPRELRVVALQALMKVDPEWAQKFAPESGLTPADLQIAPLEAAGVTPGMRQRCYQRVILRKILTATLSAGEQDSTLTLKDLSLGGGLGAGDVRLPPGAEAEIKLGSGAAAVQATVLIRGMRKNGVSFEIVHIEYQERSKLRKLLMELQK